MYPCYGRFRVKAKGVIYERVHTDIGLYMRVHIIQRYDDTMKEMGKREGRGKKGIYIYKIYRWPPPVCGVVSLRQRTHAPAHEHACMRTHTHKHTCTCTHAHAHPRHAHARQCTCMHTHTAHARMQPHNAHACVRTRTREHACTCARTHANTHPHILAAC